jgi:organic radical activating enzyme
MNRPIEPNAALSAMAGWVQPRGPWLGRRQLVVRFAGEAETATLYTATAFANELVRISTRSRFHSVALTGRDPLGQAGFLAAAALSKRPPLPMMIETDGQRPEALPGLREAVRLVQVVPPASSGAPFERALESLAVAAQLGLEHALLLAAGARESDGSLLRVVEQAHRASDGTMIVIHPAPGDLSTPRDRRWTDFLEQASALHQDVRLLPMLDG